MTRANMFSTVVVVDLFRVIVNCQRVQLAASKEVSWLTLSHSRLPDIREGLVKESTIDSFNHSQKALQGC
jgi:hypothetical protein